MEAASEEMELRACFRSGGVDAASEEEELRVYFRSGGVMASRNAVRKCTAIQCGRKVYSHTLLSAEAASEEKEM